MTQNNWLTRACETDLSIGNVIDGKHEASEGVTTPSKNTPRATGACYTNSTGERPPK
jgi:hypothetical protein